MALWERSAVEVVELLRRGEVTPLQLVDVAEARWKETEPPITAMPIVCWERARLKAQELMASGPPAQPPPGYLYGLPIAVKDLTAVKGVRFTQGSLLFKDRVATHDDPLVEVLETKGAIIVGKTNTPELGAGSQTYNRVFGTTLNPWDTTKTAGGSSGGSTAALAVGQVWLATGSDFGGSLRNPASFCGVVGLRPTIGRVPGAHLPPGHPAQLRLQSVNGPLARSVADLALLLDAMACQHDADPLSRPAPQAPFTAAIRAAPSPPLQSIAWSADLGGVSPVDYEVAQLCSEAARWLATALGAELVEHACPDFTHAPQVFQTLRSLTFAHNCRPLLEAPLRQMVKEEVLWQVEQGVALTPEQIQWAEVHHDALLASSQAFFKQHELLCCPAAMLPPFNANITWPRSFDGIQFDTYIDWMMLACVISLLDAPALSLPCGFTAAGLPVGLQLVGAPGSDEGRLLAVAAVYERAHDWSASVPLQRINAGCAKAVV